MARERLRVRELSNEDGNRLLRIVRRSWGSIAPPRQAVGAGGGEQGQGLRRESYCSSRPSRGPRPLRKGMS